MTVCHCLLVAGAVVFDCDGVLVDSERVNNEVFAEIATEAGLPTTLADSVAKYMGRSTNECVADVEGELGRPIGFDFVAEYLRRATLRHRTDLVAIPHVRDLLDLLSRVGVPMCVASSGTPEEIASRLVLTGLETYFDGRCFSASMVARGKPAPDLFLLAARGIGVDPTDCVLIEDSPYGIRGGKAAGMTTIGYAGLALPEILHAAGADHVVTDMTDVVALLAL